MNEEKIWKFLKSKGFTDFGVAGLMGNLYAESGLSPINLQTHMRRSLILQIRAIHKPLTMVVIQTLLKTLLVMDLPNGHIGVVSKTC